ncbi:PREDICTED: ethylene-insensitive protein 2-like isoform X3 [Camelina sativa]|uniref:Ethylene-insensitive protein 2-like isoform X3 n=1 Tax=Camelina sativa TaxID=90675 RepID=A0ABM0XTF4_CAMSA|nr:PREDICTED: ethylene-insensitive protein 2-like isoform X3 [Camelina sativa]
MEAEIVNVRPPQLGFIQRMVPPLLPVLLVSVGYIDPGKWVANIEGGARFGYDLVAITLLFNFAAILCQYVAARISVVTGKHLAQICNEEYDKWTCMFLGIQAEFSAILLDLTMVVGVAHALNLLFGVELSTGVFLAAIDAFLFPVFASFLENGMANTVSICSAGFVLLLYVSGVLLSQSEIPFSMNGVLIRLNGESAFALMGLLGASIVPHNFYIHSYFAGESTSSSDVDKSSLCQDHLFAIFGVFSGLSLVNYVLMNAAASVFHSTGLVVLTFHDAMSLMEQVFVSPLIPVVFLMLLFFSSQITALAWTFGGEVVLHDFLKIEIPGWLHRATIRILAVAPALYCVWTSGADGIYQLLIFTQVLVAMMLPCSVIPLFRIASSRQIMGVHKIPQVGEFLALTTFLGFLGLNIVFVVEMVFGSSEWAGGLRWNTVMGTSVQYTTLLVSSCASLCLMLWLAATPLKSASNRVETQIWNMDVQNALSYPSVHEEEIIERSETRRNEDESIVRLESRVKDQLDTTSVTSSVYDLPENILMTDQEIRSSPLEESELDVKFSASQVSKLGEDPDVKEQSVLQSTVVNEVTDKDLVVETKMVKIEPISPVEKTVSMENNSKFIEKDVEGVSWESEEATRAAPASNYTVGSDGPPSFRSLSGEGGSGTGSLSRLQGLGRAARRHLSAILDEFWGHLYDFHGQLVAEARAKKIDQLFGADQKSASSMKADSFGKDMSSGYCMSPTAKGLDSQLTSNLYESLKQQRTPGSIDSLYGLQRGSSPSPSPLVNRMQMLGAYGNTTNNNAYELSERRYSSLRAPSSSEGWEHQQPATVHGYQIKSLVDNLSKGRLEALQSRGEIPMSRSMALGTSSYTQQSYTQQLALALKQKSQNGLTPGPAPGFENYAGSRSISRQSDRSYYNVPSSGNTDTVGVAVANEKKYSSMPDISGLSMSARNMHLPNNKSGYWDPSSGGGGGGGYGTSYGRLSSESSSYSNMGSRVGVPSAYDDMSQSRGGYRDTYTLPQNASTTGTGSLWSRQPFEQFGVAERTGAVGEELRNRSNPINIDNNSSSTVDAEAKLLQSFRHCILKLIKLEGSEWLFGQSDGVDEELIDRVAAREKFIYEAETREINQVGHMGEPLISSVPNCGDGCVWRADLIVSFGVWCIHRVLDLSLMESRPELWGKYTYVLNRLQGVIDPAFSKLRTPMTPCFCLQIPASHQRASPPSANGMLPPAAKPAKGKCTTAVTLLDLIKDVEMAISCRKGRTGTAAGDVAFPKGKENLASVLKRYKRRLSNKPIGMNQDGPGSRKNLTAYGSLG